MGNNQSNRCFPIEGTETRVEFENDWFAEGRSRRAYRGTYHGDRRVEGNQCVVKLYKKTWYEKLGEMSYKTDIRTSERAQEMAMAFNKKYPTIESIEFIKPDISQISSSAAFKLLGFIRIPKRVRGITKGGMTSSTVMIPRGGSVAIEKYLEGNFINYLSNTAHQNQEVPDTVPAAFSHFTFHHSHGQILVCDLKGVRGDHGYVFTDPAIHGSSSAFRLGFFGPTDLGDIGMIKFFQNHQCTDLCNMFLRLVPESVKPHHDNMARSIEDSDVSMFSLELPRRSEADVFELRSLEPQIENRTYIN